MKIKLKQYCDNNGISQATGYRWFKAGLIPGAVKSASGTILIDSDFTVNNLKTEEKDENVSETTDSEALSLLFKKTLEYSKNNKSVEEFATYIFCTFSLKLLQKSKSVIEEAPVVEEVKYTDYSTYLDSSINEDPLEEYPDLYLQLLSIIKNDPLTCCNGTFTKNNITFSMKDGYLHSENDSPSAIFPNGTKAWHKHGKLHRENGPALDYNNGTTIWYLDGNLHRENGPAIEDSDGSKEWYINGKHHRIAGPAIECADGTTKWCNNGEYHREDGPAVEDPGGAKFWYIYGKKHRLDGPAVIINNGRQEWYYEGQEIDCKSQEEFNSIVESCRKFSKLESIYENCSLEPEVRNKLRSDIEDKLSMNAENDRLLKNSHVVKSKLYSDIVKLPTFKRVEKSSFRKNKK